MKLYVVTPNECDVIRIEANSEEEARQIAFRDFQKLFQKENIFMVWEVWDDPRKPQPILESEK